MSLPPLTLLMHLTTCLGLWGNSQALPMAYRLLLGLAMFRLVLFFFDRFQTVGMRFSCCQHGTLYTALHPPLPHTHPHRWSGYGVSGGPSTGQKFNQANVMLPRLPIAGKSTTHKDWNSHWQFDWVNEWHGNSVCECVCKCVVLVIVVFTAWATAMQTGWSIICSSCLRAFKCFCMIIILNILYILIRAIGLQFFAFNCGVLFVSPLRGRSRILLEPSRGIRALRISSVGILYREVVDEMEQTLY